MLYSTFYLDDSRMGLPILSVLEIGRSFKIHPVLGSPDVVDGLINLRGKVVTIINTGLAFGCAKVEQTEESRIYVLKNNSELREVADPESDLLTSPDNIGLHVDRISDVINVDKDQLKSVPANIQHPYYQHVVRDGDEFITILELEKVLNLNEYKELSS